MVDHAREVVAWTHRFPTATFPVCSYTYLSNDIGTSDYYLLYYFFYDRW
jgi:hypothetical protein